MLQQLLWCCGLHEHLTIVGFLQLQTYVDCTLGAGGHATAVQQQHAELQHLIGIDVDPVAHNIAKQRIQAAQPASLQLSLLMGNYWWVYIDGLAFISDLPMPVAPPLVPALYCVLPASPPAPHCTHCGAHLQLAAWLHMLTVRVAVRVAAQVAAQLAA